MTSPLKNELGLKIGNLILAICLSTVPTIITYGTLSIHGQMICKDFTSKIEDEAQQIELRSECNESAWSTTKGHIFLIGFFITLPTWLWIYLSMRRKNKNT